MGSRFKAFSEARLRVADVSEEGRRVVFGFPDEDAFFVGFGGILTPAFLASERPMATAYLLEFCQVK